MKYFYIVTFDGQIFELKYTEQKLNSCLNEWKNGGLLMLSEIGGGIHASSISKIMNEELYESYTFNTKPKLFIKDGTWYDGAERKPIRREKWKQEQMDSVKKLEDDSNRPRTKEEIEKINEIRKQISERFGKSKKL